MVASRDILMVEALFKILDPFLLTILDPPLLCICMGSNLNMFTRQELIETQLFVTTSEFSIDQNQMLPIAVKC